MHVFSHILHSSYLLAITWLTFLFSWLFHTKRIMCRVFSYNALSIKLLSCQLPWNACIVTIIFDEHVKKVYPFPELLHCVTYSMQSFHSHVCPFTYWTKSAPGLLRCCFFPEHILYSTDIILSVLNMLILRTIFSILLIFSMSSEKHNLLWSDICVKSIHIPWLGIDFLFGVISGTSIWSIVHKLTLYRVMY